MKYKLPLIVALWIALASSSALAVVAQSTAPPTIEVLTRVPLVIELPASDPIPVSRTSPITMLIEIQSHVVLSGSEVILSSVVISPSTLEEGTPLSVAIAGPVNSTTLVKANSPAAADVATERPEVVAVKTPVATATEAPAVTETSASPTVNRNSNLRGGPGTGYPIVGAAKTGQAVEITGRTADTSWYQLADDAWIAAFLVKNAPDGIAVVATPAPPVATPVPTVETRQASESAESAYQAGMAQLDAEQYDAAIQGFSRAIDLDPGLTDAFVGRGLAYSSLGNHEAAVGDFNRAIALAPNRADVFMFRGMGHALLGHVDQAIQDLETHLRLWPDSPLRADIEEVLAELRNL